MTYIMFIGLKKLLLCEKTYFYAMSNGSKILVFLQFSCLAYLVFFTEFMGQGIFLIPQISGFLLSLWAVFVMKIGKFNIQPEVKLNASFVNSGPYRLIRNPMYTGLIVFFASGVLNSFHLVNYLVLILFTIVLILKIRLEEKYLENRFGEVYIQYKLNTYRLLPYIF